MLIVISPLPLLVARIQSIVDVHCELCELIYVDSVCMKDKLCTDSKEAQQMLSCVTYYCLNVVGSRN